MTKDRVVAFRAPEGFSADPLTDLLREGARELIAQAVEAELNELMRWMPHQRHLLCHDGSIRTTFGGRNYDDEDQHASVPNLPHATCCL